MSADSVGERHFLLALCVCVIDLLYKFFNMDEPQNAHMSNTLIFVVLG